MNWISVDTPPKKDQLCITYFPPSPSRVLVLSAQFITGRGIQSFGNRVATLWLAIPEPTEGV